MDTPPLKPESLAAQALGWVDEKTRAISPPIHASTTYIRDADNQYRSGRGYMRADNPAFDQAEQLVARLEGGAQGALFASGMAAATAVFQALAPGDHVLAPRVMYWSLRNWLMNFATAWGLQVELIRGLGRHELHRRPLHSLGDCLRITEVVLLSLRIRADVLRRHQPGIVAKAIELATEVVRANAGLHAD